MNTRLISGLLIMSALFLFVMISGTSCVMNDNKAEQIFIDDTAAYRVDILTKRMAKDSVFNDTARSPKPETVPDHFIQLPYYPINFKYVVPAIFVRNPEPVVFEMATTTDRLPRYEKYGYVEFTIAGKELKLEAYRNVEMKIKPGYELNLFIPFTDLTSGKESYGGGRYLDAEIPAGDTIMLDFNSCYNPYCSYNKRYSCPVPPAENHIEVAITAGEKYLQH